MGKARAGGAYLFQNEDAALAQLLPGPATVVAARATSSLEAHDVSSPLLGQLSGVAGRRLRGIVVNTIGEASQCRYPTRRHAG